MQRRCGSFDMESMIELYMFWRESQRASFMIYVTFLCIVTLEVWRKAIVLI